MSDFSNINQQINIIANTAGLLRAFNLKNLKVPDSRGQDYNKSIVQGDPTKVPDNILYLSTLGTPVFADVTLMGGTYYDYKLRKDIDFPTIKLETVLVTVDFTERIVKTEIQGRDGTVKEYIGRDDARVSINGIITGWNNHYPVDEVNALFRWIKAPVTKGIVSTYLQNLGIDNIVVEDSTLPQVEGGYSQQTFNINCISDLPVELKIS